VENKALDAAEALIRRVTEYEAQATKGPWHLELPDFDQAQEVYSERTDYGDQDGGHAAYCATISGPDGSWQNFAQFFVVCQGEADDEGTANAHFAISSRTDLPRAIALLRVLVERVRELEAKLESYT
jgi:hypothetical protein